MAVIASGTVLSNATIFSQPWFAVFLPQNLGTTTTSGYVAPTLTGTGWGGSFTTGFVYQNDQYNTTVRGF